MEWELKSVTSIPVVQYFEYKFSSNLPEQKWVHTRLETGACPRRPLKPSFIFAFGLYNFLTTSVPVKCVRFSIRVRGCCHLSDFNNMTLAKTLE